MENQKNPSEAPQEVPPLPELDYLKLDCLELDYLELDYLELDRQDQLLREMNLFPEYNNPTEQHSADKASTAPGAQPCVPQEKKMKPAEEAQLAELEQMIEEERARVAWAALTPLLAEQVEILDAASSAHLELHNSQQVSRPKASVAAHDPHAIRLPPTLASSGGIAPLTYLQGNLAGNGTGASNGKLPLGW